MALSLVAAATHQQPSFSDLQYLFDPYSFETHLNSQSQTNWTNHQANQHQQQQQQQHRPTKILLTHSMDTNNSNHNANNINNNNNNQTTTQLSNTANRNLMSGFHHQHFGAEYEPVITFVDSPPNSEESWPDDQSKGSPGPQIIDVQTIYSNSGSRKRPMDWDPLDIGQSESTASTSTGEVPAKISHQLIKEL